MLQIFHIPGDSFNARTAPTILNPEYVCLIIKFTIKTIISTLYFVFQQNMNKY